MRRAKTRQLKYPRFTAGDPIVNVRAGMKYMTGTIIAIGRASNNRIWNMIEWEDGVVSLCTDDNRLIVPPQRRINSGVEATAHDLR